MKLFLPLFLTAWIFTAASAQENPAPAQPAAGGPALPSQTKPAMPSQDKPAMPSQDKPAMPSQDKPAMPSGAEPAMPSEDEPAMPSGDKPAQTGIISEWLDTTPDVIRSPESSFFRPFHVQGGTQTFIPLAVDTEMTIDAKTGENRLYTVPELKRKQSLELKELRKSLIKKPNSEIRKAIKARETQQKTELKSLQNRIRAEADKNQQVSPAPKLVISQPQKAE